MKAIIIALVIIAGGYYGNTRHCTMAQICSTLMFVFLCAALVVQKMCIK